MLLNRRLFQSGRRLTSSIVTAVGAVVVATVVTVPAAGAIVGTGDGSGSLVAIGGAGFDTAIAVAASLDGSMTVVGSFSDSIDLDPTGPLGALTSAGETDVYIARYSPTGTLQWARAFGGTQSESAFDVAVGFDGSVTVVGSFSDTARPDLSGTGITLDSAGSYDGFVARYSTAGAIQWAYAIGGTGEDAAKGVAVDAAGNAVVVGIFAVTASIAGRDGTTRLTAVGEDDVFVARYAANGALTNVVSAGGTQFDSASGAALLTDGSAVVTGLFGGRATFGTGPAAVSITATGSSDMFLARYAANGALMWVTSAGGAGYDGGKAVSVGGDAIFVGGEFTDAAIFGDGIGAVQLMGAGGSDAFVARYTSDGQPVWVERGASVGGDYANDVAVTADGGVALVGAIATRADFGSAVRTGSAVSVLDPPGGDDGFIARYSSGGDLRWATRIGGAGFDNVAGVAARLDGSIAVVGYFRGAATFGNGSANLALTSRGDLDGFLLQYGTAVERHSGDNRIATAVAVSAAVYPPGRNVAYIASSTGFADALVAGPIAALEGGPVLLTAPTSLSPETAAELIRLRPDEIVIVGGTNAVSAAVEAAVRPLAPVVRRVSGQNRYDTAAALSRRGFAVATTVIVASGVGFADAVSGGAATRQVGGPLLLTSPVALSPETEQELRRLGPDKVVILGGTAAVSAEVQAAIRNVVPRVERVFGADRYSTSAAIAATFFPRPTVRAYVATGVNFPDALAATPAAIFAQSPVLLSRADCVPLSVRTQIDRLAPTEVVLVGGLGALSNAITTLSSC